MENAAFPLGDGAISSPASSTRRAPPCLIFFPNLLFSRIFPQPPFSLASRARTSQHAAAHRCTPGLLLALPASSPWILLRPPPPRARRRPSPPQARHLRSSSLRPTPMDVALVPGGAPPRAMEAAAPPWRSPAPWPPVLARPLLCAISALLCAISAASGGAPTWPAARTAADAPCAHRSWCTTSLGVMECKNLLLSFCPFAPYEEIFCYNSSSDLLLQHNFFATLFPMRSRWICMSECRRRDCCNDATLAYFFC